MWRAGPPSAWGWLEAHVLPRQGDAEVWGRSACSHMPGGVAHVHVSLCVSGGGRCCAGLRREGVCAGQHVVCV